MSSRSAAQPHHPGVTIAAWLDRHRRSQSWLAGQLVVSEKHLSRIVRGRALYSAELAVRIEAVTGLSAVELMQARGAYEVAMIKGQV